MGYLIFFAVVIAAVVAWKLRVPLMAKVLGQDRGRIERQLKQRRRD